MNPSFVPFFFDSLQPRQTTDPHESSSIIKRKELQLGGVSLLVLFNIFQPTEP